MFRFMNYLYNSDELKILNDKIQEKSNLFKKLKKEISQIIISQEDMINKLLISLIGQGHILLEGVPGLAKTLSIKTLSDSVQGIFSRIQFTPDLLPADLIGTLIYNVKESNFSVKKGPIFGNFILADEINRAPTKVQSALLEAMEEKQVTIGNSSYLLEEPFMVLATQNPIEQEGTYALPEAQLDRFMLKCLITYPSFEEERIILRNQIYNQNLKINKIIEISDILEARNLTKEIYLDEKIEKYILDIIFATRFPEKYNLNELKKSLIFGCSPRATISLAIASRVHAFLDGRAFVIPEDVRSIVKDVLRHRIGISFESEVMDCDKIIDNILFNIEVP